jgi:xylono-1,5-lactonase
MSLSRSRPRQETATRVWRAGTTHAETPRWDPERRCLRFIDGVCGDLLEYAPEADAHAHAVDLGGSSAPTTRRVHLAAELGFVHPQAGSARLLCGIGTAIHVAELAAGGGAQLIAAPLCAAPGDARALRLNDSGVDIGGRLWSGTMSRDGHAPLGVVYRLDGKRLEPISDGFTIPNGFAFDRSGRTLYVADSPLRVVYAFELDAAGGLRARRAVYRSDDAALGFPDGMAVDAEDHIWIAFYEGGCVRRLRPDGSIERELRLDASRVTACAFGGDALDTLYITADGDLFAWRGDVMGLAVRPAVLAE